MKSSPLILLALLVSFSSFGEGDPVRRDTASAMVVYDAEVKFVPRADYSSAHYEKVIDSLVMLDTVPVSLVKQLSIYKRLSEKKPAELPAII
ncbi:MAG TPA: hypothetical protein VJ949_10245, partial [Cryomorphaceae bacterium]|nr:hypothetical protein [Cryomorphaceae bacterium]